VVVAVIAVVVVVIALAVVVVVVIEGNTSYSYVMKTESLCGLLNSAELDADLLFSRRMFGGQVKQYLSTK